MNMTEEEAMEIWLQRNEEIGERVRRRDERRRLAAEEAASAADHPRGGGGGEPPPTSDTANQANAAAASDGASDDGSSGADGSVGNFQHAASVTQSDAWRRAISRNVMGEYNPNDPDPSYHDAYHAYQRFVDMHKPGVADNFVPSTPGLAALMEQRRYLMARQGHLDSLVNHQAAAHNEHQGVQQMQTSTSSCKAGITSSSSPQDSQEKNASTNTPDCSTAASVRKLLNKSQEDGKLEDESSSSSNNNNKLGGGDDGSRRFFYAFSYPTQCNNKKVTCSGCLVDLYTNPLATNFFCQPCGTVTSVLDDKRGEGGDEAMWEEKMQDVEDMEF